MNEEFKVWLLTITVVIAVFVINISLQATSAKAQDLVKNFVSQKGDVLEASIVNTRDEMMICGKNPKLPSCPISKVFPKAKPSPQK